LQQHDIARSVIAVAKADEGDAMKRNSCHAIAAVVLAAPLGFVALAASATTVDLGSALPSGPVPNGYGGFNWNGAINDSGDFQFLYTSAPAADVNQFGRTQPFDFTGVSFQNLVSDISGDGEVDTFSTVISGYLNNTLVQSVTENYGWAQGSFTGLKIDDVNKIVFSTTDHIKVFSDDGTTALNAPDLTLVSSVTVKDAVAAPEIDTASAGTALTLLLGGVAVLLGRRRTVS
jgi:hypothetical protein